MNFIPNRDHDIVDEILRTEFGGIMTFHLGKSCDDSFKVVFGLLDQDINVLGGTNQAVKNDRPAANYEILRASRIQQ